MKNPWKILIPGALIFLFCLGLVYQVNSLRNTTFSSSKEDAVFSYIETYTAFQEDTIQQKKIKSICVQMDYNPIILTGSRNLREEVEFLQSEFREYTGNVRLKSFLTHLYTAQA